MDQGTLVVDFGDMRVSGDGFIRELTAAGFPVTVALWAKTEGDSRWYLYLASPVVDRDGIRAAYLAVHTVMRSSAESWIGPFDIKLMSSTDSMAKAALEQIALRYTGGLTAQPPRRMTRFDGTSLGGVQLDGAYIYPPYPPGLPV